jgi:hypothetical protein
LSFHEIADELEAQWPLPLITMTDQQLQCLLSKIRETASREHCFDKYGDDYCYDDAFSNGTNFGEIEFARELLQCIADKPEAQ